MTPSRLFIYFNERVMEGTRDVDAGAMIRDGIKSVAAQGVCSELRWPYDPARFARTPTALCYREALARRVTAYQRVTPTLEQLQGCLAHGYPVVFGFTVYESFESGDTALTGVVPMPTARERALGGHAVLAVGYDTASQRFLVRNSWGAGWGQGGYCTMPYPYLTTRNLASDFWAITGVVT